MTKQFIQEHQREVTEFKRELAQLLRKYRASLTVLEETRDYYTEVKGIQVEFEGVYDTFDELRPYHTALLGREVDKDLG